MPMNESMNANEYSEPMNDYFLYYFRFWKEEDNLS